MTIVELLKIINGQNVGTYSEISDKMTIEVGEENKTREFNYELFVKASAGSQMTISYSNGITSDGTNPISNDVLYCDGTLQKITRHIYSNGVNPIVLCGSAVRNINTLMVNGGSYLVDFPVDDASFTPNTNLEMLKLSGCTNSNAYRSWNPKWSLMPNLKKLEINNNYLSAVSFTSSADGSSPQNLETLDTKYTYIKDLDISGLSSLVSADLRSMVKNNYTAEPVAQDVLNASNCPNLKYVLLTNDSGSSYSYKWGTINLENDTSLITAYIQNNHWLEELNLKGCTNLETIRLTRNGEERYSQASLSASPLNVKFNNNVKLISSYYDNIGNIVSNIPTYEEAPNIIRILAMNEVEKNMVSGITFDLSRYEKLNTFEVSETYSFKKLISYNNTSLSSITFNSNRANPNSIDLQNNTKLKMLSLNGLATGYTSGYLNSVVIINNPMLSSITMNNGKFQEKFNVKQVPSLQTYEGDNGHYIGEVVFDGIGKTPNKPATVRIRYAADLTALRIFDSTVQTIYVNNDTSLTDLELHGSTYTTLSIGLENNLSLTGVWLSGNAFNTNSMNSFLNSSGLPIVESGIVDFRGNLSGYTPSGPAVINAMSKGWTVLY